jgi:hypothetical protein
MATHPKPQSFIPRALARHAPARKAGQNPKPRTHKTRRRGEGQVWVAQAAHALHHRRLLRRLWLHAVPHGGRQHRRRHPCGSARAVQPRLRRRRIPRRLHHGMQAEPRLFVFSRPRSSKLPAVAAHSDARGSPPLASTVPTDSKYKTRQIFGPCSDHPYALAPDLIYPRS